MDFSDTIDSNEKIICITTYVNFRMFNDYHENRKLLPCLPNYLSVNRFNIRNKIINCMRDSNKLPLSGVSSSVGLIDLKFY